MGRARYAVLTLAVSLLMAGVSGGQERALVGVPGLLGVCRDRDGERQDGKDKADHGLGLLRLGGVGAAGAGSGLAHDSGDPVHLRPGRCDELQAAPFVRAGTFGSQVKLLP